MRTFFHVILTQPLFNLLVLLYEHVTFGDLGLAIIALTILIRFLLYPLFYKALRNQAIMQKIQPEMQKIQREMKEDKAGQAAAMMKVWKENKVNPFSPILILIIQLPILLVLYRIFQRGFSDSAFAALYSFVPHPETINNLFLGLINLTKPNMIIVILAVIAQYVQARMAIPKQSTGAAAKSAKSMSLIAPILTLVILPSLSSAVGLYWLTGSIFSIFQQYFINRSIYGHAKPATQGQN
jgi:YidC/Oxa1 family membrane protein insertase